VGAKLNGVIKSCWEWDAGKRPRAAELVEVFDEMEKILK